MRSKLALPIVICVAALVTIYAWYVRGVFAPSPEIPPPMEIEVEEVLLSTPENASRERRERNIVSEITPAKTTETTKESLSFSWSRLKPLKTERTEVTGASLAGEIYVIGGFDSLARTSAAVEIYNPETEKWRDGRPLPAKRHHAASVTVGSTLYAIGGFAGPSFQPKSEVFVFNQTSGEWEEGPELPEPRGAHAAAVHGDTIYVVGGMTEDGVSADLLALDLASDEPTWKRLKSAATPREHLAASVVGSNLYVSGGRQGSLTSNLQSLEIYDLALGTWRKQGPPLPTARGGVAGAALGRFFIVFGGEEPSGTFAEAEAFDTATNEWIELPPMPTARHGLGAATASNTVYVLGGGRKPGLSVSGVSEALTLRALPARATESAPPPYPSLPAFASMELVGSDLALSSVLENNAAYTRYAIEYLSNGLSISGIMNIPKGEGPFPLVVLNHGYISPTVYTRGRGLKREQDFLARQGFAVIHPDYRGHGESDPSPVEHTYDAAIEYSIDVANAIHAVRNAHLPEIDAARVGMLGHSLGGGIALNIATSYPDLVDAIVLYAPTSSNAWDNFTRWENDWDDEEGREQASRTRGDIGNPDENPTFWREISSRNFFENIAVPILLFHGSKDEDVPQEWSDETVERLRTLGKDVTYMTYNDEKHEFTDRWPDFIEKATGFFEEHVKDSSESIPLLHPDRVTKKPFGIFITPASSPVQPERFSGYHTGTDFEALPGEDETQLTVNAICNGPLVFKESVNGYGGVLVQQCTFDGESATVLYGHLALSTIATANGDILSTGDLIGRLGRGLSPETGGERAHLHLGIHRGADINLRGYVADERNLRDWIDPQTLLR